MNNEIKKDLDMYGTAIVVNGERVDPATVVIHKPAGYKIEFVQPQLTTEQPLDYCKRVDEHFPNIVDEPKFNWLGTCVVLALMLGLAIGFIFGVTR